MIIVKLSTYIWQNYRGSLPWVKENCPSFEKVVILTPDGKENPMFITRYDTLCYHFGSEQDALLFTLRWS